jgi:ABC-type branched-subunit amino acid transport system substrate-binding protein
MFKRPLIACTAALLVVACHAMTKTPVVLGAAGPWTEDYGAMNRRGIELAVEELNARGPSQGAPVQIIFRDDNGDGMRAASIAQEFINRKDIVGVIGHVNSGAMVAAARVYDGHLPAVATTASSPALTGISPWTFRVISSDSMNGLEIARFVMRRGRRRADLVGGDGWSVLASDTTLAEGVYAGVPFTAEDNRADVRIFVERFRNRYGLTPDGNAALAYDATMLLANAARRVGPDRARLREYLAGLRESGRGYRGVTGNIAFSPDGDPVGKAIVMTRIRAGVLTLQDAQ